MPRFSANLTFLFQDLPFLDRFSAAAQAGFKGVEHQFPYDTPPADIVSRLQENQLEMVLINAPPGNWEAGERGLAGLPGRESEFKDSIGLAIDYAKALGCPRIHVMSGIPAPELPKESVMATLVENLAWAASQLESEGIRMLLEALNPVDVPGYLISHNQQTRAVMAVVNHPNVFMQYDLYHAAMNGENLQDSLMMHFEVVDHMQVAGAPGRHEPDTGNADFFPIFEMVDTLGYEGWIGCEYAPQTSTLEGLGWASVFGLKGTSP